MTTYSPAITARKALIEGVAIAAAYAVMDYLTLAPDLTMETWKPFAVGAVAAAIRGGANWWKNYGRAGL